MIPLPCPAKTPSGRAAAEHGKLAFFVLEKIFYFFVKKACILLKGMVIYFLRNDSCKTKYPGVAKFGIALEWGSRGRWFESSHYTISYEVLCGVSRRVPRVYRDHGQIVAVEDWILEA